MYLHTLVAGMVGVLMPTASELEARGDRDGLLEMLVISTKYVLVIALPAAAVFFIMGEQFIALWMGPQYTGGAVILKILTAAMVLHLVEMPSRTVLMGLSKHSILAWSRLIQAVANLGLSVLLVHYYGIIGVAIGTLIPMVLVTVVAVFVYFRRYLKLPLGSYLLRSMPLPFVIQIPFVAMLGLINVYSPPSTLSMW